MKIDQVAFYCANADAERAVKTWFGLQNATWILDRVASTSTVYTKRGSLIGKNVAELQFNYDLGIELEIIRYLAGPNWVEESGRKVPPGRPFINHVGIHLGDKADFPEMYGATLVQETFTESHTSDYLTNPTSPGCGRLYHYQIWETAPGSFIKYIRRIHPRKS